ncbi:MAG: hypothetical protein A3G81_00595 [Betaproteobacteria bacterium RIFCSPLOWO2_12_FULL_65_14]|nr:MAG: hypothetical protein A3G81_00595 [Betaproteobacteria bacterium RIFCSPLOWO2_12_FULL_65_14]
MIYPIRMLVLMALTLLGLAAGAVLEYKPLVVAFESNALVNGAILGMLALGIVVQLAQASALVPATRWIDRTRRGFATKKPPRVIAPVAAVLAGREREGFTLSMLAVRSLIEAARVRLKDGRDVSHFLIGLLVALGVGGALWPLAAEPGARLQNASLLLGVAAALALAVLHLQLRHAQNVFLGELEEFLSERAQLPSAVLGTESTLPAFVEALLKQAAESLVDLQRLMTRADEDRRSTQAAVNALVEQLAELSDQLRAQQKVMTAISKNHSDLLPAIHDFANQLAGALAGGEELRGHVRKIDVSLARLADDAAQLRVQGFRPSRAA